ncbi:unnamed protein product, partial [Heterosigma akashiwo]
GRRGGVHAPQVHGRLQRPAHRGGQPHLGEPGAHQGGHHPGLQLLGALVAHRPTLPQPVRPVPGQRLLRAPDPLVQHLQQLHDGHLPLRPRLPHPHAHPQERFRQVRLHGRGDGDRGQHGRGLGLEAGARRRVPGAAAPGALRGAGGHGLAAGRAGRGR